MILERVVIQNFRGIQKAAFNVKDYSLIVGPNNAGKSTVIDAIRVFYEKDGYKYKKDRDQPFFMNSDFDCYVELTYELSESEWNALADQYKREDQKLCLVKFLNISGESEYKDRNPGVIYCRMKDGALQNEQFYGAKNVQSGKIGDIIYIPAVSKVDDQAKLTGPSPLRELLTDILADVLEGSSAYTDLEESVNRFASVISDAQTDDERSINDLQVRLNEHLKPWQTRFSIKFKSPSIDEIIKQMLGWEMIDKNHEFAVNMDNFGSGFQRHFIYSLIRLRTSYAKCTVSPQMALSASE